MKSEDDEIQYYMYFLTVKCAPTQNISKLLMSSICVVEDLSRKVCSYPNRFQSSFYLAKDLTRIISIT